MNDDLGNILSVKKRETAGKPPHEPTEENISLVKSLVKFGVKTVLIAEHLNISEPTLFKHYKQHMASAKVYAHGAVGKSLFEKAVAGDTTSAIWYSKTQMGWKEAKNDDDDKDKDESSNLDEDVIDERIERLIAKRKD